MAAPARRRAPEPALAQPSSGARRAGTRANRSSRSRARRGPPAASRVPSPRSPSSGRSKWSIAPLQNAASKLPSAKGSASDQPRTQRGSGPGRVGADWSCAHADHARRGLGARRRCAPRRASAMRVLAEAARHVEHAHPGRGRVRASVTSVMRSNRYSLSRVVPVGMTSLMSRSRSTTRTVGDGSGHPEPAADRAISASTRGTLARRRYPISRSCRTNRDAKRLRRSPKPQGTLPGPPAPSSGSPPFASPISHSPASSRCTSSPSASSRPRSIRSFRGGLTREAELRARTGPLVSELRNQLGSALDSAWIRPGGVRVDAMAIAADGHTLLFAHPGPVPSLPAESTVPSRAEWSLFPAAIRVNVSVPHNSLAANVALVFYATLFLTTLLLYMRILTRRENERLRAVIEARDGIAERASQIETELVQRARAPFPGRTGPRQPGERDPRAPPRANEAVDGSSRPGGARARTPRRNR